MTPAERGKSLAIYPPQIHERILAKVQEYLALDPNERELRLRATDLRWYLLPLLLESPTNRTARLALVPDDLRELVNARLAQWDALPPPSRQEFLANEQTLDYFSHVDSTNVPPTLGGQGAPSTEDQARWNALSESERRQISAQFDRFFELTPDEKQKALNTLSDAERVQMEKTLQTFGDLAAHAARPMHPRLHGIRRHVVAGTRGIFEERRPLVANDAEGPAGVARSRCPGSAVAAGAARAHHAPQTTTTPGAIAIACPANGGHQSQLSQREIPFSISAAAL